MSVPNKMVLVMHTRVCAAGEAGARYRRAATDGCSKGATTGGMSLHNVRVETARMVMDAKPRCWGPEVAYRYGRAGRLVGR